jgi:hypothetical protein
MPHGEWMRRATVDLELTRKKRERPMAAMETTLGVAACGSDPVRDRRCGR